MTLVSRLLLTAAIAATGPAAALAADYNPPVIVEEAPEYVPVEVGSGWYLRGDVAYNVNEPFTNTLFGDTLTSRIEESSLPISASVGFGYHVNDYFRVEANIGLLGDSNETLTYVDPAVSIAASTDNQMWSGMVSAYGDLGTYAGFTPYIGAGVGLVSSSREYQIASTPLNGIGTPTNFIDSDRAYSVAYSVGAGVSYEVATNWSIDLGYQYFMAPDAERVFMTAPDTYIVDRGVNFHQVKLGVRYDLW